MQLLFLLVFIAVEEPTQTQTLTPDSCREKYEQYKKSYYDDAIKDLRDGMKLVRDGQATAIKRRVGKKYEVSILKKTKKKAMAGAKNGRYLIASNTDVNRAIRDLQKMQKAKAPAPNPMFNGKTKWGMFNYQLYVKQVVSDTRVIGEIRVGQMIVNDRGLPTAKDVNEIISVVFESTNGIKEGRPISGLIYFANGSYRYNTVAAGTKTVDNYVAIRKVPLPSKSPEK